MVSLWYQIEDLITNYYIIVHWVKERLWNIRVEFVWLLEDTERWTPVERQKLWSASCCQTGWHSTWFTAGGTFENDSRSCSFFVEKLLTPTARACPEAYKPSMALHVSGRHSGSIESGSKPRDPGLVRNGQWICIYILKHSHKQYYIWLRIEITSIRLAQWLEVHRAQNSHDSRQSMFDRLNIFYPDLNFFFIFCVISPTSELKTPHLGLDDRFMSAYIKCNQGWKEEYQI